MTHPGLIVGATPGVVAVVAAETPSAVLCEVLKYRSVREVLLFPPWDPKLAAEARLHISKRKLNEEFYKQWKCADDSRVHLTQWASPAAGENAVNLASYCSFRGVAGVLLGSNSNPLNKPLRTLIHSAHLRRKPARVYADTLLAYDGVHSKASKCKSVDAMIIEASAQLCHIPCNLQACNHCARRPYPGRCVYMSILVAATICCHSLRLRRNDQQYFV